VIGGWSIHSERATIFLGEEGWISIEETRSLWSSGQSGEKSSLFFLHGRKRFCRMNRDRRAEVLKTGVYDADAEKRETGGRMSRDRISITAETAGVITTALRRAILELDKCPNSTDVQEARARHAGIEAAERLMRDVLSLEVTEAPTAGALAACVRKAEHDIVRAVGDPPRLGMS
jgi:hypothetical protein